MSLEWNKIFAAILVAGILAQLSGFISNKIFHKEPLAEDAFKVEVADAGNAAAVATAPKGPEPILALLADADVTRGEKLSKACAACHSFNEGGPNKIGPNLWNVVGAEYAHLDDFAYSDALQSKEGVWDYAALNHFLWKPKDYIPGTKMNYIGMKKPEDRASIIAWLRTLSSSPAALPSAEEIAASQPPAEEEVSVEENSDINEQGMAP